MKSLAAARARWHRPSTRGARTWANGEVQRYSDRRSVHVRADETRRSRSRRFQGTPGSAAPARFEARQPRRFDERDGHRRWPPAPRPRPARAAPFGRGGRRRFQPLHRPQQRDRGQQPRPLHLTITTTAAAAKNSANAVTAISTARASRTDDAAIPPRARNTCHRRRAPTAAPASSGVGPRRAAREAVLLPRAWRPGCVRPSARTAPSRAAWAGASSRPTRASPVPPHPARPTPLGALAGHIRAEPRTRLESAARRWAWPPSPASRTRRSATGAPCVRPSPAADPPPTARCRDGAGVPPTPARGWSPARAPPTRTPARPLPPRGPAMPPTPPPARTSPWPPDAAATAETPPPARPAGSPLQQRGIRRLRVEGPHGVRSFVAAQPREEHQGQVQHAGRHQHSGERAAILYARLSRRGNLRAHRRPLPAVRARVSGQSGTAPSRAASQPWRRDRNRLDLRTPRVRGDERYRCSQVLAIDMRRGRRDDARWGRPRRTDGEVCHRGVGHQLVGQQHVEIGPRQAAAAEAHGPLVVPSRMSSLLGSAARDSTRNRGSTYAQRNSNA